MKSKSNSLQLYSTKVQSVYFPRLRGKCYNLNAFTKWGGIQLPQKKKLLHPGLTGTKQFHQLHNYCN
jgi:hypothetical protein